MSPHGEGRYTAGAMGNDRLRIAAAVEEEWKQLSEEQRDRAGEALARIGLPLKRLRLGLRRAAPPAAHLRRVVVLQVVELAPPKCRSAT